MEILYCHHLFYPNVSVYYTFGLHVGYSDRYTPVEGQRLQQEKRFDDDNRLNVNSVNKN